ncbi:MAG: hypothetical protein QW812_02600 [Thermoplasmataceae archaeon]
MRIIPITVIVLATVITAVFPSHGEIAYPLTSGISPLPEYSMNFSQMPIGTFPSNSSVLNFSNVSLAQGSRISVENNSMGRGLNINADSASNLNDLTLFQISTQFANTTELSVTFSWNQNNNFAETGNQILITNNNFTLCSLKFGPEYNYSLYLISAGSVEKFSEPRYSQFLSLYVFFSGNLGDSILLGLSYGYGNYVPIPVQVNISQGLSAGSVGLILGGAVANLTLYTLSVIYKESYADFPGQTNNDIFQYRTPLEISGVGSISSPLIDANRADIIFVHSLKAIEWYNINNGSYGVLRNISGTFSGTEDYLTESLAVFAFYGENGTNIYTINLTSFSLIRWKIPEINGSFPFKVGSNELYAYFAHRLFILNLSTGELQSETLQQNLTFLSINVSSTAIIRLYNADNGTLAIINADPNGITSELYHNESSLLRSAPSALTDSYGYGMIDMGAVNVFTSSNESWLVNGSAEIATTASGKTVAIFAGTYYIFTGDAWGSVVLSQKASRIWLVNSSIAIAEVNDTLYLYWSEGAPFSTFPISIQANLQAYYRGNCSIDVIINSSAPCTVYSQVDGVPVPFRNGTIKINSTSFPNGTNTLNVSANNSVGNSEQCSFPIVFDNYAVSLTSSFSNGSAIAAGSYVNFTVKGVPNCTAIIHMLNNTYLFDTLYFTIKIPQNTSGDLRFFLTVLDPYGRISNWSFSVTVVSPPSAGDFISPQNESYFNSSEVNFSWKAEPDAQFYSLLFLSTSGRSFALNTTEISTRANLSNGNWTVLLFVAQADNATTEVGSLMVHVETFPPGMNLSLKGPRFLSFAGNSNQNYGIIEVSTNLTCYLHVIIEGPNGTVLNTRITGNYYSLNLDEVGYLFTNNGTYNVTAISTTFSNLTASRYLTFSVNNTIPPALEIPLDYYTNQSAFSVPLPKDCGYRYTLLPQSASNGTRLLLMNNTLIMDFYSDPAYTQAVVEYANAYGNHNSAVINVNYSAMAPSISISVAMNDLIRENSTVLFYNVSDPEALVNVSLFVNDGFYEKLSENRGDINISFKHNGNYTYQIRAEDICGNSNDSPNQTVKVDYFISVHSVKIKATMLLGIAFFQVILSGNNTNLLNVTVLSGNTVEHRGDDFLTILMPGYHNLTFDIQGNNYRDKITKTYFTFGFLPLILPATFAIYTAIKRRINLNVAREVIMQVILESHGESLRDIAKKLKNSGANEKTIISIARRLEQEGRINVKTDMDGDQYIFRNS